MSSPTNAAALILNGGRSRRMGGADKSRIVVDGQPIVHRQCKVLRERFQSIAMVGSAVDIPQDLGLDRLTDRVGGKGPLDGIAAGLAWSPAPWLFVLAGDMPYPSLPLIDSLLAMRGEGSDIVCVATEGRAQPLFALYHGRLLPALDSLLAQDRLRASELVLAPPAGVSVLALPEAAARRLDPELLSFQNLNSPEDVLTSEASIE